MKKVVSVILAVLVLAISLCGCSSTEKKYLEVVNQYLKEEFSMGNLEGQDTYVKIVDDDDVEAYVYGVASIEGNSTNGIMFVMKKGALKAYENGESLSSYVKRKIPKSKVSNPYGGPAISIGDFEAPTLEELENEWEHFES